MTLPEDPTTYLGSVRRSVGGSQAIALAAWLLSGASSASAGAWLVPAREWRAQLAFLHQDTSERYFLDGQRIPFFFEGRSRASALVVDAARGFGGLDLALQVPIFFFSFDDLADDRSSAGFGDVRITVRARVLDAPIVVTAGATGKMPTGAFDNDAEVVPVGEGQWDYDGFLEVGRSFWPRRAYVTALAGYRARTRNATSNIDPGDEFYWSAEVGHRIGEHLTVRARARGLHGRDATTFGIPTASLRREAVYLSPGVVWDVGDRWGVDVSVPFTLRGRNWPSGSSLSFALFAKFK